MKSFLTYLYALDLQEYKKQFEETLQAIETERQRLVQAEDRWMVSWNASVDKVRQLYN